MTLNKATLFFKEEVIPRQLQGSVAAKKRVERKLLKGADIISNSVLKQYWASLHSIYKQQIACDTSSASDFAGVGLKAILKDHQNRTSAQQRKGFVNRRLKTVQDRYQT